jgi:glycosyltransferase 2 family protein
LKKILKYLLPIAFGLGLFYWVFKDMDLMSIVQNFKDANYFLVSIGLFVAFVAHASRGVRWKLMLEPMGYKVSSLNATAGVLIGYMTNLVLPRAGELARSVSLQNTEEVPFEKSFGAVLAERVIDVLVLLCLLVLNILLEFDRIKDLVMELLGDKLKNTNLLLLLLAVAVVSFSILVFIYKKYKKRILAFPIFQKITTFLGGLWAGFSSVLKMEKPGMFVFHTVLIWSMYYLSTYILCMAVPLGQNVTPLAVLTILVMGSIGMAAPTIGGIGSYHLLVGKIMVLYGLSNEEGINLATFLHTMQGIIYVVILGVLGFAIAFFSKKKSA